MNESDVLLASASNAVIVAFNVKPDRKATDLAQREGVEIRTHTIIYELLDELRLSMAGLLSPILKEQHLGRAEVRNTFRVKGAGTIAGCYVTEGLIKRNEEVRVLRAGAVVHTGKVSSLKRFKEDAGEVRAGFECGIGVSNFNDVQVGDVIDCFKVEKTTAVMNPDQAARGARPERARQETV